MLYLGIFFFIKLELKWYDVPLFVGGDIVNAPGSDFVIAKIFGVFDEKFVEIKLDFIGESCVVSAPFMLSVAGFEVGDGDGLVFFVDFDAIDFAGHDSIAKCDGFRKETAFRFGVSIADEVASFGEEFSKFGFATFV